MSEKSFLAVRLSLPNEADTTGTAEVFEHSISARAGRAIRTLALFLLAAFFCVFIPLAHFILVPVLAIAGVVFAVLNLREGTTLSSLRGACPRCRVLDEFPGPQRFFDGCGIHCDACGSTFTVALVSGA